MDFLHIPGFFGPYLSEMTYPVMRCDILEDWSARLHGYENLVTCSVELFTCVFFRFNTPTGPDLEDIRRVCPEEMNQLESTIKIMKLYCALNPHYIQKHFSLVVPSPWTRLGCMSSTVCVYLQSLIITPITCHIFLFGLEFSNHIINVQPSSVTVRLCLKSLVT